jgi:hypothetical protein
MHEKTGEMVMAMVRMGVHAQTMCRPAPAVDLADKSHKTVRLTAICKDAVGVVVAAVG